MMTLFLTTWEEYKNGNTLVVRTVFEKLQDETIYISSFQSQEQMVV